MEHELVVAVVILALLVYALAAEWIERSPLSGPMLFTALGVAVGPIGLDLFGSGDRGWIIAVATATLVIVLFRDAANIRLTMRGAGRATAGLAARLLLVGIPLTIAAGALAGWALLPQFTFIDLVILAIILTPTDAALAQPVFTNADIPETQREAINAESGFNDGLCLPLLLIALELAVVSDADPAAGEQAQRFLTQILLGPLAGGVIGFAGGWMARRAFALGIARPAGRTPVMVLLAGLAWVGAELAGGNGFLAAFVAGMAFALSLGDATVREASGIALTEGTILTNLTFVIFGAWFVPSALAVPLWPTLVYAALSLTAVRMLPVLAALAGTGVSIRGKLVIGWFGPRGVASILYLLVVATAEEYHPMADIQNVAVWTILISVVLHGVTAPFAGRAYAGEAG
ncbi:MAG TPA: cation:proton antiporter [Devosiaceae bacterium]|nr:cation:proton antiporter [Devosiaceae bacterium]